jgi:hypothetical protein
MICWFNRLAVVVVELARRQIWPLFPAFSLFSYVTPISTPQVLKVTSPARLSPRDKIKNDDDPARTARTLPTLFLMLSIEVAILCS